MKSHLSFNFLLLFLLAFGLIIFCVSCGIVPLKGGMRFPSDNITKVQVLKTAQPLLASRGWQVKEIDIVSGTIHTVYRGSETMSWTINVGKLDNEDKEGKDIGIIMTITDPAPVIAKKEMIKFSKELADTLNIEEEKVTLKYANFWGKENKPLSSY